jgi:hypothetical protein
LNFFGSRNVHYGSKATARPALSLDRCTLNCGSSRASADAKARPQPPCLPSALLSTAAKRMPARLPANKNRPRRTPSRGVSTSTSCKAVVPAGAAAAPSRRSRRQPQSGGSMAKPRPLGIVRNQRESGSWTAAEWCCRSKLSCRLPNSLGSASRRPAAHRARPEQPAAQRPVAPRT